MVTNILCSLDRSETSRRAFECAVLLARVWRAKLSAVEVLEVPIPPMPPGPWEGFVLTDQIRRAYLDELTRAVQPAKALGIDVPCTVREGRVVHEILAEASRLHADLLVMGTHGRGGFERFVLGSVAEKVLRLASCPVLVVPPRPHPIDPARPFQSIMCAVDFSASSIDAVAYAASLARETSAKITLVHVVEWPFGEGRDAEVPPEIAQLRRSHEDEGRRRLQEVLVQHGLAKNAVETVVTTGKAWRDILRVAQESAPDLIVMGIHGRGAMDLALLGSTTHHVIRQAPCPVLTVRTGTGH